MRNEFDFIHSLRSRSSASAIGDDCAVLPKNAEFDLLITADMLIEDIDFRLEWAISELLGHKALAVSLSDIAAMGGKPLWAMLSIGVPESLWAGDFMDRFYAGWYDLADQYGVELVGGDVSRSPDKLVIDSIVGGEVAAGRATRRSGARTGDGIFVTGTVGAAAGGLKLLEKGVRFGSYITSSADRMIGRQLKPKPQLAIANILNTLGIVTSAIDLSDGISSDLTHICSESGVGATIDSNLIPVDPDLKAQFPPEQCLAMALSGGEDFELLFTADKRCVADAKIDNVTCIGTITPNKGVIELTHDDSITILCPSGFRHF